ncbi:MAG: TatD family hydrolase [Bacteroidales bacterium]|nr:TatD family hydrolase [Bacteroidales bacterium]
MIIDTHSHIYMDEDYPDDKAEVVERLKTAGVGKVILPNVDLSTIPQMHALADTDPDLFSCAMGLHPTEVKEDWQSVLDEMFAYLTQRKYCALGEIGIDLYWEDDFKEIQIKAFEQQVDVAIQNDLPIIIHQRKALDECTASLKKFDKSKLHGVFHCFTGNIHEAEQMMKLGDFVLGIGGVVTFKNAGVAAAVKDIPLDRIVLETDAPYLAPVPKRGQRNETAFIAYTAAKVAEIKEMDVDAVADATSKTAIDMFGL